MLKQNYETEVLINGKPAKEYAHEGKIYIEGRRGTRFSIRIRNNSYSRKLFVPTIDGLSVMNGEEGSFDSSGYIVQGYSSITIEGWRISDKDIALFYFSSPEDSYRRQMKRGSNLGIIGVAVFEEVFHSTIFTTTNYPTTYYPQSQWTWTTPTGSTTNMKLSSMYCNLVNDGSAPSQQLGTGWGEEKRSEVTTVNFERVNTPDAVFEIHYNTREELEKAGINFKKEPLYVTPQAFPGQYCKPPKYY